MLFELEIDTTPFAGAAGAVGHVIGLHTGVPDDNGVHATEPGPMTLHVRIVAVLIAKPAVQWYVAVVGVVGLYSNEVDE